MKRGIRDKQRKLNSFLLRHYQGGTYAAICGMMDEMLENKDDILWSKLRLGGKMIMYIFNQKHKQVFDKRLNV